MTVELVHNCQCIPKVSLEIVRVLEEQTGKSIGVRILVTSLHMQQLGLVWDLRGLENEKQSEAVKNDESKSMGCSNRYDHINDSEGSLHDHGHDVRVLQMGN